MLNSKHYYPTVNLLRAAAALMVCIGHIVGYIDPLRGSLFPVEGWLYAISKIGLNGIFVFFVVSGFVITLSLFKSNYSIARFPRFLSRRFVRIELPYFASIGLILFIRMIYSLKNHTPFDFNLEQIFYHMVYYIPFTHMEWLDGAYWTLAIEFQFYIIIGILFILFNSKNKWITFAVLLLFSATNFFVTDDRFVFHYSIIFAQGILLSLVKSDRMKSYQGLICICICLLATTYLFSVQVAVFCSATVIMIQFFTIDHKIINRLGEISYSLYLTHATIAANMLYLFFKYFNGTIERLVLGFIVLISSLIAAYVFWWVIENPSRKLSKKIKI